MGKEEPDISELAEKAKIVAEATGREETQVLADLLDDGIVNMSNENSGKDLVTQLKEAAELITTVQAINKDVAENTVLNGGDNKTEVQIETTLEGDIVDRAIQSIQRKSENIKKLLITMTPLFLLITGGGLEALGIIDVMDGEEGDDYDDYIEYGGCMAFDADNYDSMASWDDGTCYWDDNNGGGGGPPVNCQWIWSDNSFMDNENHLVIRANFEDNSCPHEMEGRFAVELHKDGEYQMGHSWENIKFKHNYEVQHSFPDLGSGVYRNHFIFETYDGSNWNWDSPETHEVIEEPMGCDAYLINEQSYLLEEDDEKDAVRISADITLIEYENNCDSEQFEITWRLYEDGMVKYEHTTWEDGNRHRPRWCRLYFPHMGCC